MTRRSKPNAERPIHRSRGRSRTHRVVYVAVEGEITEVDYLTYVNKELIDDNEITLHVIARSNGLKPTETVTKVLDVDDPNGELWVMFDRDEHAGIPQAFSQGRKKDVEVVFSHPSFDLWLLLHFQSFSGSQNGSSKIVHEKLRQYPGYETFGKQGDDKGVKGSRVDSIRGKGLTAVRNARKLTKDCAFDGCSEAGGHADRCDPLRRDPSTDVWRLLASLKIIDI
ncbi:RloB family protein [Amycolatopsis thailandensis]|uniref:RloB family protein n=1 Tax=Amycolatopsis thailandensis TaxID=589330 RepID=UPI0036317ABD